MRGLFDPAALAPERPPLALRCVAFEDVGRRFALAPFREEIENRGARHARCANGAQPNGRPAGKQFSWLRVVHSWARVLIQPQRTKARYTAGTLCASKRISSGRWSMR